MNVRLFLVWELGLFIGLGMHLMPPHMYPYTVCGIFMVALTIAYFSDKLGRLVARGNP